MIHLTESELESAIREVIKRSVVDPEFRALAVKDGNSAIAKASGKSLPSGTMIHFVSNHGTSEKSFVLPDPISTPELLNEEALEQVAGGSCLVTSCGTSKVAEE
jgi:hypothetical protein